jgi:hypothetical protein
VTTHGALHVLAHALTVDFIIKRCLEERQIQTKVGRESVKRGTPETRALLQKQIVHLPEFALIGRRLRRLRSDERVGMRTLNRMMAKYEPHTQGMAIEYLSNGALNPTTHGTFKIPIFDNGYTRMGIPAYVVGRDHRIPEVVLRFMNHVGSSQLTITAHVVPPPLFWHGRRQSPPACAADRHKLRAG